VCRQ
jgi:hypothetical protein